MSVPDELLTNGRPWTPRVTVAAVIERAGQFLMVEESVVDRLCINQPAGHLEDGESLLDAVVRETLEETAREFVADALLGVYRWRHPDSGETFLRFAFCGTVKESREERALDADIVRALWLSHADLLDRRAQWRSPLVMRCVDDYLAGRRFPLDLLTDEQGT